MAECLQIRQYSATRVDLFECRAAVDGQGETSTGGRYRESLLGVDCTIGGMDKRALARLAQQQHDVLSLAELRSVGMHESTAYRRAQDGQWTRLLPGVFLTSHGRPTFQQKLAAVVKWCGNHEAVFHLDTAAYLHRMVTRPPQMVQLLVPFHSAMRTVQPIVRIQRTRRPMDAVGNPPRTTLERTAADMIHASQTKQQALEVMIHAIRKRLSPHRFEQEVRARKKLRHRTYIEQLIRLPEDGVESHLELAYLSDVERAHNLPTSTGQRRELIRGRWIRSDRWYPDHQVRCELDGELAHPGRMTDADVMRDNDVRVLLGDITLRYRWPQVTNTPCDVAVQVTQALQHRGWTGHPTRCSSACDVDVQLALAQGRSL